MGAIVTMLLFFLHVGYAQPKRLSTALNTLLDSAARQIYVDFDASEALLTKVEQLLSNEGQNDYPFQWIELSNLRAMASIHHGKFSETGGYLDKSVNTLKVYSDRIGSQYDSLWYATLFLKCLYLSDIGTYDSALHYLTEIEAYYKAKTGNEATCRQLYGIKQYLANIYDKKGEYESAINGYLASNFYYDCYRNSQSCPNYVLTYRNVAEAFFKMGDVENALTNLWKGRKNLDSCFSSTNIALRTHAIILYESFGRVYTAVKQLDSADFYLQKAMPLLNEKSPYAYRIQRRIASIERQRGNFHRALDMLTKTLSDLAANEGNDDRVLASVYVDMSELHDDLQNYDAALAMIQKAIGALCGTGAELDLFGNPSAHKVTLKKEMVNVLRQKSSLLLRYYGENRSTSLLQQCHATNKLALQFIDSMRNDFTLDKDKVILGEQAIKIFEMSVAAAYKLYSETKDSGYLNECFEFMDGSKSAVLLDHLKLVQNFSGVPPSVLQNERQLKAELTIAEENLYKSESQGKDAAKERESLGDLKRTYAQLFSYIKTVHPGYYKLRIDNKSVSLREVQTDLLTPARALVEYFLSDTTLFVMSVTTSRANIYSVGYPLVQHDVAKLKALITRPNASSSEIEQLSNQLYQKLIFPWLPEVDSINSLIIIPHGVLAYLPFEMLSDRNGVLIERFNISYASSASLLAEQKQMQATGHAIAGFNADYSNHSELQPLVGSQNELNSIHQIFGNKTSVFFNAKADQFRQHAPSFKVLHLALHSFINDEKPLFSKLVFSTDDKGNTTEITANELYAMQLNAELAVLSACESGIGKLHRGEGMMSLSRAFMYAGVPSTVISLWKVPDHATARLMEKFYTFLKAGQSKDEALANAKRSFIKEYPEMSAPYFWAGFVVNGKTNPLTLSTVESGQWSRITIPLLFIALITTVIIQWRRHQTKDVSVERFVNHR